MRTQKINTSSLEDSRNILYLMERDNRLEDNYCVELGYKLSYAQKTEFIIGTELVSIMNNRQRSFYLEGLSELGECCKQHNIKLVKIKNLEDFIELNNIGTVITEYSPLLNMLEYQRRLVEASERLNINLYITDSHNIVPARCLSVYKKTGKSVKIQLYKFWSEYLADFKKLEIHKFNKKDGKWRGTEDFKIKTLAEKVYAPIFRGGSTAGMKTLEYFLKHNLLKFHSQRNSPDVNVLTNLSPYIHMGHISAQRVVLRVLEYCKENKISQANDNVQTLLNEIFVWRETAEHFCYHNKNYSNLDGALQWAKDTLLQHSTDKRAEVYNLEELEAARTEDDGWNAAQIEMLKTGKMHGYARMYWAKKLLYWTESPQEALKVAIYLNDKYSLDANDPNGYLGIMWSICGSMDQGFKEREIIGKIRPMSSHKGKAYTKKWTGIWNE